MPEPCPAGRRCVGYSVVDGEPVAAPLEGNARICKACWGALHKAVRDLPDDYHKLRGLIGEQTTSLLGPRVAGTPETPVPINTRIEALRGTIVETAERAADLVSEPLMVWRAGRRRGWPAPGAYELKRALGLIEHHLDVLLEASEDAHTVWRGGRMVVVDRSGVDVALDLIYLHRQARRELGLTTPAIRQHTPCPRCQHQTLVLEVRDLRGSRSSSRPGDLTPEVVSCRHCGDEYTEAEFRWLVRMVLSELQQKEVNMLQWLLAEQTWLHEQAEAKLNRIRIVTDSEVDKIPSVALVELIKGILDGEKAAI